VLSAVIAALPRLTHQHVTIARIAFPASGNLITTVRNGLWPLFFKPLFGLWRRTSDPLFDALFQQIPDAAFDQREESEAAIRAIAAALNTDLWAPPIEIAPAIGNAAAAHFLSEFDAAVLVRVAVRASLTAVPLPAFPIPLPLSGEERRLFEARGALAGEPLTVDDSSLPRLMTDQKLHREWTEIEREAEDRGVNPYHELMRRSKDRSDLALYGLRQMKFRLDRMALCRSAVRARLLGLAILDIEAEAVSRSLRALEIAVWGDDVSKKDALKTVKGAQAWLKSERAKVAVETVVALAPAKAPRNFAARVTDKIASDKLTDAAAIARAATDLLRDDPSRPQDAIVTRRVEESLALFDSAARGFALAFLKTVPLDGKVRTPADWRRSGSDAGLDIAARQGHETGRLLMKRYRDGVIASRKSLGSAALSLTALMEIYREVLDSSVIFELDPPQFRQFAAIVAGLLNLLDPAASLGGIPLYEDVKIAIREAASLVKEPDQVFTVAE
jgi:hypothetical protein